MLFIHFPRPVHKTSARTHRVELAAHGRGLTRGVVATTQRYRQRSPADAADMATDDRSRVVHDHASMQRRITSVRSSAHVIQ